MRQNLDTGAFTPAAWRERRKRRDRVLEIFPPLAKLLDQSVGTLSGGERRMVSLGRAFMGDPRVFLVDEPSLGLAPIISRSVVEALGEIDIGDGAMIIAEQDLGLIQGRVDRMLGMHAGELKQDIGDALLVGHAESQPADAHRSSRRCSGVDWFVVTSALSLAAMYGLLGIGISLTWSSIGMLNLAHGFTFASAGYGAWWASKNLVKTPTSGTDALIVGAAGILIGVVAGLCVGLIAFLPLHDRPNFPIRSLIATLAISLGGTQVFLLVFGPLSKPLPKVFNPVAKWLDRPKLELGPMVDDLGSGRRDHLRDAACAVVLTWVRLSRRGIQMRAMMQNPEGAALVGVSVRSTGMMVMGICGGMAGLSAVLLSSTFFVSPSAGTSRSRRVS